MPQDVKRLRRLPSVDAVLRDPRLVDVRNGLDKAVVTNTVREVLARARAESEDSGSDDISARVSDRLARLVHPRPARIINATGTILHTNLGRAPLSAAAVTAIVEAAQGYCDLEVGLASGSRTSRQDIVEDQLKALLNAEAAIVTVSNAAAVLLTLRSLAGRREVIVSRGQAVEIGDGFRLPSIMREAGVRLVEVGTTNRTTVDDYAEAVTPRTAAILYVHPSNFAQIGFVESAPIDGLAAAAHHHGLPLLVDNGSGSLVDTARFGLVHEPMPAEALAAGADVVTFSTDKLLGGPQGGVIAGRSDLIQKVARHPLARAVRPDKLSLAGLNATLLHYLTHGYDDIPVLRMLSTPVSDLSVRARRLAKELTNVGLSAVIESGESKVGGGSLPGETLPTTVVAIDWGSGSAKAAQRLREGRIPVFTRVRDGKILLDPRTVQAEDDVVLIELFATL